MQKRKPSGKGNSGLSKKKQQDMEEQGIDYDSMIENGTSEDSDDDDDDGDMDIDDDNDESNDSKESMKGEDASEDSEEGGSDDGFSEQETETVKQPRIVEKKPKIEENKKKRKLERSELINSAFEATIKAVKKPKSKGPEKVKPPTLEEINELKETRNLFHSNLFRLQVKEMLEAVRVKEKHKLYVSKWLVEFAKFLESIENQAEKEEISKLSWLHESSIHMPISMEALHVETECRKQRTFFFQFLKPTTEPFLIGAAATETLLGPQLNADICVPMPAACFQKENYLNLIYDQKRALYLSYIANEMISKKFSGIALQDLHFSYHANNPLKPILEIRGIPGMPSKLTIRLFVTAEEQAFKLSRFVPWNSNIRGNLFQNLDDEMAPVATPNYNANVLHDLTMQSHQKILNETFSDQQNYRDALLLLKVWLQQRQLQQGFSGLKANILAMFIAYLRRQRKLHANMSSYQIARAVWNHLAVSTWDVPQQGITMFDGKVSSSNHPTLEQFHVYYDVVFIDITGFYNICANVSLDVYRRVRMEAKLAVDMLNDMKLNSFQQLFMVKRPLYSQLDHILKISSNDAVEQIIEMHVEPAIKHNYAGYTYPQLLTVISRLLRRGLGKRIQALLPLQSSTGSWSVQEEPLNCGNYLHLGIILDADNAYEVLEKGPESIAPEAEEFRKFWGEKAQLRRFQDGSVIESVVWALVKDTLASKRLVVRSIVMHLLEHHFQLDSAKDITYIGGELDVVYRLTPAFKADLLPEKYKAPQNTDAEALALNVIRSFDDLGRMLRGLTELPLEIVSIVGISPVFRYCDPTPILQTARPIGDDFFAMQTQYGLMQLAMSGKWPSELSALRAMKTAFYIEIAKLLRDKHKALTKATYEGVMILKQGYCFNIEIAHPKELALLKKEKTEKGITQYVDCDASIALEKRQYVLPKITGALHGLYQQYPSFAGTVMIAKRWLYSQLIDDGLWPDECTELLIASQFLKASSTEPQVICSPQTGFIRFLQLLAQTDWRTELFILNFNNDITDADVSDLEHRFNASRQDFPPLSIATAYDPPKHYGTLWTTKEQPNDHVLARVTLLARQALEMIETNLLSTQEEFLKPSKLFIANHQGYDLVIQLKPDMVPNTLATDFGSCFAPMSKPNWRLPLAGTNFLRDAVSKLREAYSDFAAFFYNPCGGKDIGIVWKPNVFNEKEFKITDVNASGLSESGTMLQCQRETLIEDFKFILKDFYLRIDTTDNVYTASKESTTIEIRKITHKRYFQDSQKSKEVKIPAGKKLKKSEIQKKQITKKTIKSKKPKKVK